MTEQEALAKMVSPGTRRKGKYREGVIQIHVARACDKACFGCTQGSNLTGPPRFIDPHVFEQCVKSLRGYFGVVGIFGGNPATHPAFGQLCAILREHIPFEQRGLWCNHPLGNGGVMRDTFNPSVSNLNVHLDRKAYDEFKRDWPECRPVGLTDDSRHSPPFVAMRDVLKRTCSMCGGAGNINNPKLGSCVERITCPRCDGSTTEYDESRAWDLISRCPINQHWSAMCGQFRGEARAWFCEIAGAQAILHQDEPDYPDTGVIIQDHEGGEVACGFQFVHWEPHDGGARLARWWEFPMSMYANQVRKHCHDCGVPMQGYGALAQNEAGVEQVSATHAGVYQPKRKGRRVELVTVEEQLGKRLELMTKYLQNSKV